MTRIIAILYILYSICTSSSNVQFNNLENYYSSQISSSLYTTSLSSSNAATDSESVTASDTITPSDSLPSALMENPGQFSEDINHIDQLKNLGFLKEESADKNLNIRNAVIRFQGNFNMDVTGIWDDNCMNVLINRLNDSGFSYEDIVTAPPSAGKWIVINKTKRILTLYQSKSVIKKYPVALGNPPSLTPSGKYTTVSRVINPVWGGGGYAKAVKGGSPKNPLGYRWMGLSYGNGKRIGIHGNNSPSSIGKNISHGCIRMINSDVEELFNLAAISTPVWIGTEKELGDWGIIQPEYCVPLSTDF